MTDIAPTVPLPEPAAAEFRALLSGAGVSGRLSLDALVYALPVVEFNPELIEWLQAACAAAGVVLDEANESPVPDEIQVPERPDGAVESADVDEAPIDAERVARAAAFAATIGDDVEAPSRRSRPSRTRTSDGGSSDDPVRMYLGNRRAVARCPPGSPSRCATKRGIECPSTWRYLKRAARSTDSTSPTSPATSVLFVTVTGQAMNSSGQTCVWRVDRQRYVGRGMVLLDLVQEGNLGLCGGREVRPHQGFKFSTYGPDPSGRSPEPSPTRPARSGSRCTWSSDEPQGQRQMHQELKREPTVEELAAEVDEPVEKIREILRIGLDPLSLDCPSATRTNPTSATSSRMKTPQLPLMLRARHLLPRLLVMARSS